MSIQFKRGGAVLLLLLLVAGLVGAQTPTSIRLIQMNPSSFSSVTIEGVVTVGAGKLIATRLQAYVEDTSGYGIEVFKTSISAQDQTDFVRGNRVRISGTVQNYSTTHAVTTELTNPVVTVLGTASLPDAPLLTVAQTSDSIHWEGGFFAVEGTITGSYNAGYAILWDLQDAASQSMTVKVPTTAGLPDSIIQLNHSYRIRGVGEQWDGHIEIDLLYPEDITAQGGDTDTTIITDTGFVSIRSIQLNPNGFGSVTIEGVVTIGAGVSDSVKLNAYVQDTSGYGINIYRASITSTDREAYVRGNHVRVQGTVSQYLGTHGAVTEITNAVVNVLGTADLPATPIITVGEANDTVHYEGTYFAVAGTISNPAPLSFATLYDLTDDNNQTITIMAPLSAHLASDILQVGPRYRVRGVGEAYNQATEMILAYAEDVSLDSTGPAPLTAAAALNVVTDSTTFIPSLGEQFTVQVAIKGNWRYYIQIYDMAGNPRRTMVDQIVTNAYNFQWDGKDQFGDLMPAGTYVVAVEVTNTATGQIMHARKPAVLAYSLKKP